MSFVILNCGMQDEYPFLVKMKNHALQGNDAYKLRATGEMLKLLMMRIFQVFRIFI